MLDEIFAYLSLNDKLRMRAVSTLHYLFRSSLLFFFFEGRFMAEQLSASNYSRAYRARAMCYFEHTAISGTTYSVHLKFSCSLLSVILNISRCNSIILAWYLRRNIGDDGPERDGAPLCSSYRQSDRNFEDKENLTGNWSEHTNIRRQIHFRNFRCSVL